MKIALLGYGKMGKIIERIAVSRGHEIVQRVEDYQPRIEFNGADVAIDFSVPSSAVHHIESGFDAGVPVVSGTTGWLDRYDQIVRDCEKKGGALIYSSNYSLGVNIFFEINKKLAALIAPYDYRVTMEEIHHIHKLDAPSGTAITLAEQVLENNAKYTGWELEAEGTKAPGDKIPVAALRIGETPGTHTVRYDSDIDSIEIKHTANNREGFALGAVLAAEWLAGKKGVHTIQEVLFSQK